MIRGKNAEIQKNMLKYSWFATIVTLPPSVAAAEAAATAAAGTATTLTITPLLPLRLRLR